MSASSDKIPFAVEISRMIELLATQIYPTPYALLRENIQNAFDAILLRKHLGHQFDPVIDVTIEPTRVMVVDNGIGMTREDLKKHFWRAGSSSKNTEVARAAGVVGTFGIGAMANFGIAEDLMVETESAQTGERTCCNASRSTLSVTEDCIAFEGKDATGNPGTTIIASIQPQKAIKVAEAEKYIFPFVAYLPIDVKINGRLMSRRPLEESVATVNASWNLKQAAVALGDAITADVDLSGAVTGDIRISLKNIQVGGRALEGAMILRQGLGHLQTFRSGFGLATATLVSAYQFGGVADFLFLQPTAGREALTTESLQLLQKVFTKIDDFVSVNLAHRPESNVSQYFVGWVAKRRRFDLCANLRVRIEPGDSLVLNEVRRLSQTSPFLVYSGNDSETVKHASEERPIIMLSRGSPRRDCELGFLRQYCKMEELSDEPKVLQRRTDAEMTSAEKALAFRIASILSTDYFLEAHIKFGNTAIPLKIQKKCWLAGLNLPHGRHEKEKHDQANTRQVQHLAPDLQSYSRVRSLQNSAGDWSRG